MAPGTTTPRIVDPPAPALDSPCCPAANQASRGAAGHSGKENGQGPLSPRRPLKATRAKKLGPMFQLASALISARPSTRLTVGGSGLLASRA